MSNRLDDIGGALLYHTRLDMLQIRYGCAYKGLQKQPSYSAIIVIT